MAEKVKPTWAARLPGGLAPDAWDFLHSLPHDWFLWPYDVDGTAAHVRGLESAGVLSTAEAAKLVRELQKMRDHPHLIDDGDEDVHSAIDRLNRATSRSSVSRSRSSWAAMRAAAAGTS